MWDVFLSYSRSDVERVRPLARVLRDGGLDVFTDETGVASFAGISDTIRRELSRSKALLAYYSAGYPEREACQWELTTAYLAGLREGDPRGRVMVVNPEATTDHIHPVELRDARHAPADGLTALVADVREHVARLDGPMAIQERAPRRAANGVAELRVRSLLAPAADGGWGLHPVTLHAWHHHDPAPARTESLRHAALRSLCGHRGPATLAFPGGRREAPMAAPSESERMAAFDIQVELVTRIGVQELAPGTGSLREALTSLKSLIDFTRGTLHTYSVGLERGSGAPTVQSLAYALVNDTLRPFTSTWHPRLAAYEARCPADTAPLDHEAAWPQAETMRTELTALREPLLRITEALGGISGADFGVAATG